MNRKLLVIHPNHCVEVAFDQQLTIGRDVYNSLCLQDPEISRSHAIIFEQDEDVSIKDLKSRNGIYINGEKVSEQSLKPGDEIIIGATVMLFEPTETLDLAGALSKRGRHLIEKRAKSSRMPQEAPEPPTVFSCAEMDAAIDRLLTEGNSDRTTFLSLPNTVMLLQAMKAMDDSADAKEAFDCALDQAFKIIGGSRGVVMEIDEAKERLKVRSLRASDNSQAVVIGEPVLRSLLDDESCLFCANVARDPRFAKMGAKNARPIHGFIAAPIRSMGEMIGFIYLDTVDTAQSYDYAGIRSLYMIAAHAGALLRQRPMHFPKSTPAVAVASPSRRT